jgi:trimethylamine--corrinoid protein Co-methyltransferase
VPGGLTAIATDMRYGTVNFNSPEAAILLELGREVSAHVFGWTDTCGAIRSLAKATDVQAGIEKLLTILASALHGARTFSDVGQLSLDELFSFEQAVIDQEIIACAERFLNGFTMDCNVNTLELVREALADGHFLGHPTTLEHHRDFYWTPRLLERRMLGSWQAAGSPTVIDKAREIARETIAKQFPRLDTSAEAALQKLYVQACREI